MKEEEELDVVKKDDTKIEKERNKQNGKNEERESLDYLILSFILFCVLSLKYTM